MLCVFGRRKTLRPEPASVYVNVIFCAKLSFKLPTYFSLVMGIINYTRVPINTSNMHKVKGKKTCETRKGGAFGVNWGIIKSGFDQLSDRLNDFS